MKLEYIKKFETETEYNKYMSGDEVVFPNVSLIGVDDVRYNPIPPISAGMICYADSNNNLKFVSAGEWKNELGTAQGVVVVPSNHTPDGTARIMCIKGITTAGTESSSDIAMVWGPTGETSLPNMDKVPTWDNTIGGTIGNSDYGYLPSDSNNGHFTGATCATDSLTKYAGSTLYIPSPYLEDGSQNPAYINTVEATTGNCLSDFDGKGNTAVLVGLEGDYVAAKACNLYGTNALPAGSWYLPACGELGYIMPRFNEIQTALSALSTVGGVQLGSYDTYWSSTEYSSGNACYVYTYNGYVSNYGKSITFYVRAFASVSARFGF